MASLAWQPQEPRPAGRSARANPTPTARKADPSRRCPNCRHVSGDSRRSRSAFMCVRCGYAASANVVGALNIGRRRSHVHSIRRPCQGGSTG
ncbi:zinc ribbon domain-containing protein [Crossiella sp. NPDC003009]